MRGLRAGERGRVAEGYLPLPRSWEELRVLVACGERLERPKVVGCPSHGAARRSDEEVCPPAKDKVQDQALEREEVEPKRFSECPQKKCLLRQSELSSFDGVGNVSLAMCHVVGVHVMHSVRSLPRKVWN